MMGDYAGKQALGYSESSRRRGLIMREARGVTTPIRTSKVNTPAMPNAIRRRNCHKVRLISPVSIPAISRQSGTSASNHGHLPHVTHRVLIGEKAKLRPALCRFLALSREARKQQLSHSRHLSHRVRKDLLIVLVVSVFGEFGVLQPRTICVPRRHRGHADVVHHGREAALRPPP